MALKISFSDGTIKEFDDVEDASMNEKLDKMLSPGFGKGKASRMIADGLELSRLSAILERKSLSRMEKKALEGAFYSLAKKIRDQSQSYLNPDIDAERIAARDAPTDSIWGEGISQHYKPMSAGGESVLLVDRQSRSRASLLEGVERNGSMDKHPLTFKLSIPKVRDRLSGEDADAKKGNTRERSAGGNTPEM